MTNFVLTHAKIQPSSKNNNFSLDLHMQIKAEEVSVGGYDLQCIEKVKLICPECTFLLKEAVQIPNGTRMCGSCFEEIARYIYNYVMHVNSVFACMYMHTCSH